MSEEKKKWKDMTPEERGKKLKPLGTFLWVGFAIALIILLISMFA
jgi:hypothetical protein